MLLLHAATSVDAGIEASGAGATKDEGGSLFHCAWSFMYRKLSLKSVARWLTFEVHLTTGSKGVSSDHLGSLTMR